MNGYVQVVVIIPKNDESTRGPSFLSLEPGSEGGIFAQFFIDSPGHVRLRMLDLAGNVVATPPIFLAQTAEFIREHDTDAIIILPGMVGLSSAEVPSGIIQMTYVIPDEDGNFSWDGVSEGGRNCTF